MSRDEVKGLADEALWDIGRRSLHIQKHTCASCGYPAAKVRKCTFSTI